MSSIGNDCVNARYGRKDRSTATLNHQTRSETALKSQSQSRHFSKNDFFLFPEIFRAKASKVGLIDNPVYRKKNGFRFLT